MSLKTLMASALVALTLTAGAANAFASDSSADFSQYPTWAQQAFTPEGGR